MSSPDRRKRRQAYKQQSRINNRPKKYQPKRGGPGIILTCETGRDAKAKREGIEIITYYHKTLHNEKFKSNCSGCDKLTLEEELAQLKTANENDKNNGKPWLSVFDTGCRGTVFLVCTTPNCTLIPKISISDEANEEEENSEKKPESKKPRTELSTTSSSTHGVKSTSETDDKDSMPSAPWDPVDVVRRVMNDLHRENISSTNSHIPGSRYVSRMIPIQATCFPSIREISATFRSLLDHLILPELGKTQVEDEHEQPTPISFSIKFKKRNCGSVTRDQVIDSIVEQVDQATKSTWTVNLEQPDYRIQVEICKTLCGISILSASKEDAFMSSHNFNLAELRAGAAVVDYDDKNESGNMSNVT